MKTGTLEVSGLLRWKAYSFILTHYGFLHWFASTVSALSTVVLCSSFLHLSQDSVESVAETSVPLQQSIVTTIDPTKFVFQVEYTPSGLFSTSKKYQFRARSEPDMVDWIIALKQFTKK
jgi:hypothetical protein